MLGDGLIVRLRDDLQSRHEVGHVVRVLDFELVAHRFNLGSVRFNLSLVLFQGVVRLDQHVAEVLNVAFHI